RHTRFSRDWSSDVCSSDLGGRAFLPMEVALLDSTLDTLGVPREGQVPAYKIGPKGLDLIKRFEGLSLTAYPDPGTGGKPWTIGRSEERRVGKECRYRGWAC